MRLGSLYSQTKDWLEILANAVYRPWKTHPNWGATKEYLNHYDTFPLALRVAQAQESIDAGAVPLERQIGSRLLRQGWRKDAFDLMVEQVASELGVPTEKFNVDVLDHDLPHQPNNTRKILKSFLEHSAKTESQGILDLNNVASSDSSSPGPTDRYLVEVARTKLLDLIRDSQLETLTTAKPTVKQIVDDPLAEIRSDVSGIDEFNPALPWDEFLKESLGYGIIDQAVLGVLSFSNDGRLASAPESSRTYIVVPKRLVSSLPELVSDKVQVIPSVDPRSRPVEIVSRVDVVGPLDFSKVALFETNTGVVGHAEQKPPLPKNQSEEL